MRPGPDIGAPPCETTPVPRAPLAGIEIPPPAPVFRKDVSDFLFSNPAGCFSGFARVRPQQPLSVKG